MELKEQIKSTIRSIPNFPKEGINFKDITPLIMDPSLSKLMVKKMVEDIEPLKPNAIAGIESRGFLYGFLIAQEMNLPFVLIRKKGKLPYETVSYAYELEYDTAEIEMHTDAVGQNDKVIIHDDLLATGGSAKAAAELIHKQNAEVSGFSFIVDLSYLKGAEVLKCYSENIYKLVSY